MAEGLYHDLPALPQAVAVLPLFVVVDGNAMFPTLVPGIGNILVRSNFFYETPLAQPERQIQIQFEPNVVNAPSTGFGVAINAPFQQMIQQPEQMIQQEQIIQQQMIQQPEQIIQQAQIIQPEGANSYNKEEDGDILRMASDCGEINDDNSMILEEIVMDQQTFAHLHSNPGLYAEFFMEDGSQHVLTHTVLVALVRSQRCIPNSAISSGVNIANHRPLTKLRVVNAQIDKGSPIRTQTHTEPNVPMGPIIAANANGAVYDFPQGTQVVETYTVLNQRPTMSTRVQPPAMNTNLYTKSIYNFVWENK